MAAGTEMAAGVGLALGAGGPLPAAAAVGLMTVAARTDHRGKGFFVFKGGWEYVGVVGGAAVALAALGPGPALLAAGLGVVSAAVLLKLSYHPDDKPAEPAEQ
jgi:putative oxidoreductase